MSESPAPETATVSNTADDPTVTSSEVATFEPQPDTVWQDAVWYNSHYVFKISTPKGWGTGFFIYRSNSSTMCGIATATHVIKDAHEWELPIRIRHHKSGKTCLLTPDKRATYIDQETDTALIVFDNPKEEELFPSWIIEPNLWLKDHSLKIGNEVGWLGFPSMVPDEMCFFSGRVSCSLRKQHAYLIDGVAINGVSGGPAFFVMTSPGYTSAIGNSIIGVISAYVPNRIQGETLPGLALVKDVSKLHEWIASYRNFDEAKKAEQEQSKASSNEPTTNESANPPQSDVP